jgi:hypothetical protein
MATELRTIDSFRRATARRLRANSTAAEVLLWRELRKLEPKGTHFRRQVPIGPYVADFACLASRQVTRKIRSSRVMNCERTGSSRKAIRFWNQNPAGVLDVIYAALYGSRDSEPKTLKHRRKPASPHPGAPCAPTLPLQGRVRPSSRHRRHIHRPADHVEPPDRGRRGAGAGADAHRRSRRSCASAATCRPACSTGRAACWRRR